MQKKDNIGDTASAKEQLAPYIHKLNNLLTVIQGNAELLKLRENCKEDAEEILDACEEIVEVLATLRQTV